MLIEKSDIIRKLTLTERLSSVKAAFTGLPNKSLLSMARSFIPVYGEPPRRSTGEWMEMYHNTPRLNNPVHQIASDVGCADYGIYNKKDKEKMKIPNHALEKLLKNPNTDITHTGYVLFYLIQVYLLLPTGESFVLKERNGLGKVTELYVVPPSWVSEIPSRSKDYFTIQPLGNMNATPIHVPKFDVIYFKHPDVSNPYTRGIGRSNAIGDEIEVDEQASKWQKRFFYNGALPSVVGMMPGADQPTIDRTEELFNQKYGGVNNSQKTSFLNWDAKFQVLATTQKDMDFVASRRFLRDEANQFFNIPPELMGILESSNRSTISAAYFLYSKNVLRKTLKFISDVLNTQLIPDFDENYYIEFDQVVPEDEEFELKKASEGLKNGGITVNEWRRANGWRELPDGKGDILYVPLNMIPVPLSDKAIQVNLEPQQTELPKSKALTPEMKTRMWYVFDKTAIKSERSFINALKKYFQGQQDRINKSLEKSIKAATSDPDELLDWVEENKILLAALSPLWLASLKEGFEAANATYGFGISFDLLNPKFLDWVKEFGANQVQEINDTTKDKLKKTLAEGIEAGEGMPKLRDRVAQVMTEAKTSRAEKIARTETHNTVGIATQETYEAANVKKKEWLTAIDGRERESHAAINHEVVGIDEAFSNGLRFPGDPSGAAEEVISCRCVLLPVLPD